MGDTKVYASPDVTIPQNKGQNCPRGLTPIGTIYIWARHKAKGDKSGLLSPTKYRQESAWHELQLQLYRFGKSLRRLEICYQCCCVE